MTKVRTLGLSLLCSTFLAACGGQKAPSSEIEAPTGPQQTSFTLDHHYDSRANVTLEIKAGISERKVTESIRYSWDYEELESLETFTSIDFDHLRVDRFYQSLGNNSGQSYSTWFLSDRQKQDDARLRNIFTIVKNKVDGRATVICEKPQDQKILTCVVSKI